MASKKTGKTRTAATIASFEPTAPARPKARSLADMPIFERGRERVSLNGAWRVQVDPMRTGWQRKYWAERRERIGGRHVEFDYDAWRKVRVPGDWNTQVPEMAHYDGPAWYARRFGFRPRRGERLFLRFGAANYIAQVFLNGELLGEHEGGFTPFEFEITGRLGKSNTLVVMVDSTLRPEGAPTANYDWYNYGGLTRPVEILRVPESFVRGFRVSLVERRGRSFIRAEVRMDGGRFPREAVLTVPGLRIDGRVPLRNGRGAVEIPADPVRWCPESPRLYRVKLAAGGDSVSDRVGFRVLATRGREILLNGEPLYLRGISCHEERPVPGGGRALRSGDIAEIFRQARALGCNFVRLAHYPHTEEQARLADRLGIMLWEEIPVYWRVRFDDPRTLANCRQQLGELITRDFNRASVIIWSVGNETPLNAARDRFFTELIGTARRLDPTRLVSAAFVCEHKGGDTYGLFNKVGPLLDVAGVNEYFGWYGMYDRKKYDVKWDTGGFDGPVVFSELGAGARAGVHGRAGEHWCEEHQAAIYTRQLRMIAKADCCAGLSPWILFDFRSLLRTNRHQKGYNRKGLVAPGGRRKLAFGVLRKFYAAKRGDKL